MFWWGSPCIYCAACEQDNCARELGMVRFTEGLFRLSQGKRVLRRVFHAVGVLVAHARRPNRFLALLTVEKLLVVFRGSATVLSQVIEMAAHTTTGSGICFCSLCTRKSLQLNDHLDCFAISMIILLQQLFCALGRNTLLKAAAV